MTWLLVLLAIELTCFFMAFWANQKDIMAPSVVLTGVFIISTFVAILNVDKWQVNYSWEACLILSIGIILFCFTDAITRSFTKKKKIEYTTNLSNNIIEVSKIRTWLIIIVDIFIVYLVYQEVLRIAATNTWFDNAFYAYRMLTSHSEDADPEQLMDGKINQAMKIVIVSGFMYAFFYINNILTDKTRWKKDLYYLIPPILLCVMTLITGVRTNILRLFVFCLICGYILFRSKQNWRKIILNKFIKISILSISAILITFSILQDFLGRNVGGSTDQYTVISNYVGAPIIHFNQYIQNPPAPNQVYGQETFAGVWNVLYKLGISSKTYSAHEEFRRLTYSDYGNVYTLFRRFIQDFGFEGMCIMTIFLSYFLSNIYNKKIRHKSLNSHTILIIIEYGYLYYIIAMASIDNFIHDYINIGTIVMFILLHLMFKFSVKSNQEIKKL